MLRHLYVFATAPRPPLAIEGVSSNPFIAGFAAMLDEPHHNEQESLAAESELASFLVRRIIECKNKPESLRDYLVLWQLLKTTRGGSQQTLADALNQANVHVALAALHGVLAVRPAETYHDTIDPLLLTAVAEALKSQMEA